MENLDRETKLLLREKINNNCFILLQNINSNLNRDLKKNVTQSVLDLLNCYFCLNKVEDPLLCPKCHNFACKNCLKSYFGNNATKKCPLCKQDIKFTDLKENKIVKEIKNILSTDKTQKNTIDEFSKVIKEKQQYYLEQKKDIQDIIKGFNNYKECLEKYKIGFNEYLAECQQLVEKTFNDYYKTIQNLIQSLLSYDKIYQKSFDKYDEIYNKVKDNYFNSENIKEFINEILYLERKQMNNSDKLETKKFLLSPITFKPNFNNYSILVNKNLKKSAESLNIEFNSQNLGKCELTIDYSPNNNIFFVQLKANTHKSDYEKCYLVKLRKKGGSARDFIMKNVKKQGQEYVFGCRIEEKNLFNPGEDSLIFNVDVLEMDTYNN
jgi:hypothetical protein